MKILVLALSFKFVFALIKNDNKVSNFDMHRDLHQNEMEELKKLMAKEMKLHDLLKLREITVEAALNDFIDKLLANVREMIVNNGVDSTFLQDLAVNIGIGKTYLTEGQLNDTSTVKASGNSLISYNSQTKKLTLTMTLRFENLKFIYNYYTKVLLFSMTGHLYGNIKDVHVNIQLGFDFNKKLFFVDSIDFKDTGSINLMVSGNALVDWITNAMSFVLTALLHNVILNRAEKLIADPIDGIIDNSNKILHPSI